MKKSRKPPNLDPSEAAFREGCRQVSQHPIFSGLYLHAQIDRRQNNGCPAGGWATVSTNGIIRAHPSRRAEPAEWVYILAHCLLHLGLGHFEKVRSQKEWFFACDCAVARFLADIKLGRPPQEMRVEIPSLGTNEEELFRRFQRDGYPEECLHLGTAGEHHPDMVQAEVRTNWRGESIKWRTLFGEGLIQAVHSAVRTAGGHDAAEKPDTLAQQARRWFINRYPLLGSLAAGFRIIEDALLCQRMDVSVGAVDAAAREIYINPAAGLGVDEVGFVMAHELLHVGLRHSARCQGRDHYLWNVACDYVINGWLVEMGVGVLPKFGALYDPELKGLSAEGVYDRIVTDLRRYRKLATLRGFGLGDMLEHSKGEWWETAAGVDLDDFYRRCMTLGLACHRDQCRGDLPFGLEREIEALSQPPMPWDVALARWFDGYFAPIEKIRTYSRASRRQSSTPDIARPRWAPLRGAEDGRTFAVVLDTSGSMSPEVLSKALGAIASYAMSRDVPFVRVIYCDAAPYDAGYMPPEAIAGRVRIKGRGGTVLQPAIDLLMSSPDFPAAGPLLVITDGRCDRLRITREHAFLLPQGCHLPFVPVGEVFRIK